jgi:two-component system chemotaxis response regulator CheY
VPGLGVRDHSVKVLLVDDSALSRKVQSKVLQEIGAKQVIEAKNGLDALERLEQSAYAVDLVMTDWNMPAMDGVSFIRELRKRPQGRRLPVIVVSSEGESDKIETAFSAGANSYVTKPFKKEVLARKIQSCTQVAALPESQGPAATGGGKTAALSGDLERLGFGELVQFLSFSRKTGDLNFQLEGGVAGVNFGEGNVRDAWIGRFSSEEAFFAIARLRRGRFEFNEGPARPPKIKQGTLALLMEAMRLVDEDSGASGQTDTLRSPAS